MINEQVSKEKSFSETLQELIDKKGMNSVEVYKRALLTKNDWYGIIRAKYQPRKEKILALAIALELSLDETEDLLASAEYTFNSDLPINIGHVFNLHLHHYYVFDPNSLADMIVKEYIKQKEYDIAEINKELNELGCDSYLGSKTED